MLTGGTEAIAKVNGASVPKKRELMPRNGTQNALFRQGLHNFQQPGFYEAVSKRARELFRQGLHNFQGVKEKRAKTRLEKSMLPENSKQFIAWKCGRAR